MKAKKTSTAKKTKAKKSKAKKSTNSRVQFESQQFIVRISKKATEIQKAAGKKTIPAKNVFIMNRSEAVKKAAKMVK